MDMPDIFITRHGKCVHNNKEAEFLWHRYSNDDIMGLTLEGIAETATKAREFAKVLDQSRPVSVVCTNSIRSRQTASLLVSELTRKFGFGAHVGHSNHFDEIPRPTLQQPLYPEFDFHKMKDNIHYEVEPGGESFMKRVGLYMQRLTMVNWHGWLDASGQRDLPNTQYILVGHHYSLSAFITAILANSPKPWISPPSLLPKPSAIYLAEEAFKRFYFEHDDFFYVSHLIGDKTVARSRKLQAYTNHRFAEAIEKPAFIKHCQSREVIAA